MTRARGQALLIIVLSTLLLVVFLAMTLAIGQRAKERVELQTVTDVAAYDSAVATARAFNSFAVLNRAAVSHWVALSGTEALIAWSSPTSASNLGAAEEQARDIQRSVVRIEVLEQKIYQELYFEVLFEQRYQKAAAAMADGQAPPAPGAPYRPQPGHGTFLGGQMGCREVCHAVRDPDLDLSDEDDLDLAEIAQAVQGSRGQRFVVLGIGNETVHTYIRDDIAPAALVARGPDDRYYDAEWYAPGNYKPDPPGLAGDQSRWQSISAVKYGPGGNAAVISTASDDNADRLGALTGTSVPFDTAVTLGPRGTWYQDGVNSSTADRLSHPVVRHPGVFRGGFGFIDGVRYHSGKSGPFRNAPEEINQQDLYGMPTLPTAMWRVASPGPLNPWELMFRVQFSRSGPGAGIDLHRGKTLELSLDDHQFHTMGALASGFVYYHRKGHYSEPANMLNPFWRATLIASDIDQNGQMQLAALGDMPAFGDAAHEQHWLAGWRPGDEGTLLYGGPDLGAWLPTTFPDLVTLEYRLVNQGGFKGVP